MHKRWLFVLTLITAASMVVGTDALAAGGGIDDMGNRLKTQIGSLTDLIGASAFVVGLVFGASGLMKFKQHSENPQGVPITHALVRLLVAGGLIALPSVLGTSVGTLFSTTTVGTTDFEGGGLSSIQRK